MKIQRSSSIDQLYEKVKDFELVLTVEAPLADALNNRLDRPTLGRFATTPMRLVLGDYENEQLMRKRELFLHLVESTDLGWKQSLHLLENILSCWKHTGDLRSILGYERFASEETRKALDAIEGTKNVFSRMQNFRIDPDLDVAVIGYRYFNQLDRRILPKNFERVELMEGGEDKLPPFKIYSSANILVKAIEDNITDDNKDDVAIVLEPDSEYQALVESILDAKDITYLLPAEFRSDESLRLFLETLEKSLAPHGLKVGDIQPLLKTLEVEVDEQLNNQLLERTEHPDLARFKHLIESLPDSTFGRAIRQCRKALDQDMGEIENQLEELDFLKRKVTEENLNLLQYYLDSFNITTDTGNRGVLFASPKSTAYIDKPIVFYLGMDASWIHEIQDKPWIDQEMEGENNLEKFKLLLQNGKQRHFMVQNWKMNQEVSPCFYFNEISGERFQSFDQDRETADYFHVEREQTAKPFEKKDLDVDYTHKEAWSQSSLNKLYWCPRMYFFDRLIDDVDTFYKKRGTLFHDFAELYVNRPGLVEEKGLENFLERIMEEIKPFRKDLELEGLRTKFRIGLKTIKSYIDGIEIDKNSNEGFEKRHNGNFFAEKLDIELDTSFTEMHFNDPDLAVKGTVDLIISPEELLDFKTGFRKSEKKIVARSNLSKLEEGEQPEFQALLYLTHQRSLNPGEELKFIFLHVFENVGDKLCGDRPIDYYSTAEITYYPRDFHEHLLLEETFEWLSSQTNALEKALSPLGYSLFVDFFEGLEFGDEIFDREELKDEHLEPLEDHFRSCLEVGRGKDITENQLEKGADRILNYIYKLRNKNYFQEDLDRFEEFLQEQKAKFNQNYIKNGFPVGKADLTARRLSHKDLIIND